VHRIAAAVRGLQQFSCWRTRLGDRRAQRPNLHQQYAENTVRDFLPGSTSMIHLNFDNSPFSTPAGAA